MTTQSRRQFLGAAGSIAAAAGAFSMLPASIARALAIPARTRSGTIEDVEHVVIMMQENRSFDHYFGTMPGVRGFGDRFTIPLPGGRTVWEQSDGTRNVLPYHLDSARGNAQRVDGTPHSWRDSQDAWDGGRMSEWAVHKESHSMGFYRQAEIPFQWALADAFTLCDAYHCSIQAGTNPNRLVLWTGTNGPTGDGTAAVVNEWDYIGAPEVGYQWTTYPERLQRAGVSWKVYQFMPDNFGDNSLSGFIRYREANKVMGNDAEGAPYLPYEDSYDSIDPLIKGIANTMPDGGFMEAFRADIGAGRLPQVSWIVAPAAYSEHPDPSSPVQGAWYVEDVLRSLTADPEVWARTVLLVNFDENDGYFDHVPPPAAPALSVDGMSTGASTCDVAAERFTHPAPAGTVAQPAPDGGVYGMGPRVPMLVLSPWSRGGWVDSEVFDHTSVIRFLEARFAVEEPNISPWRRVVAGDLTSAFNFADPNHEALPTLPTVTRRGAALVRAAQERRVQVPVPLPSEQRLPLQPAGTRPSRALPYEVGVGADVDLTTGAIRVLFANTGTAGAVFHVYDRLHLDRLPRRYTVEAGASLVGDWSTIEDGGRYDLWLLGPNGFHRTFAGAIAIAEPDDEGVQVPLAEQALLPEVLVEYEPDRRVLRLTMANRGAAGCSFSAVANEYGNDERTHVVSAGRDVVEEWDLEPSSGWYDVSVTVAELPGFERRLAGRLENGEHGISDPALGG